jgi:adenylylsulfate kinase
MCFWFTGLSGAGKSTLAYALHATLHQQGAPAHVLDGDELRRGLCSDLGLSEADRRENIRRAGEVARLFFDAGLVVICAFVSPYAGDRAKVRALFPAGRFIEVHVATPLAVCAERDPKGLYAKAKAGQLSGLTGWDAPYEAPEFPELVLDTQALAVDAALAKLLTFHTQALP